MGLVVCGESVGGWLSRIGDRVVVVVARIYTPLIDRYIVLIIIIIVAAAAVGGHPMRRFIYRYFS